MHFFYFIFTVDHSFLPVPNAGCVILYLNVRSVAPLSSCPVNQKGKALCESRGGHPGLPVPNSLYGLCGHKATLEEGIGGRAQDLCESRGGRPGLPVPNSLYGLCKATLEEGIGGRSQELCESRDGRPGLPVPSSLYGLCGRKATNNIELEPQRP